MNRRTEYIEEFNTNIVNLLNEIISVGIKKRSINNVTLFHLNQEKYPQSVSVDVIPYEGEQSLIQYLKFAKADRYMGYYWIQFELEKEEYRISMYFKACDRETGNQHIFPGAIQIYRKQKNHGHSYVKNGRFINVGDDITKGAYTKHHGSIQYCEENWVPIHMLNMDDQKIPMLWDYGNKSEIAEIIWEPNGFIRIDDYLNTISVTNHKPISVEKFYSIDGKYEDWYDLVYPPESNLRGMKLQTAYRLLKFDSRTRKNDNIQIQNFLIFELRDYGFFTMYDGVAHDISYDEKLRENSEYKDMKFFYAGPNYLVESETDISKKDWKFIYKKYE